MVGLLCKRVQNKTRYTLWVLLMVYLIVLICSTVICRKVIVFEFDRLQLMPFWTYKAVIHHTPGVSVWDIVLNVALFMPLGFLVKLISPAIPIGKMLLIAFGSSVFIEVNQYYWEKGAVQIDDVMHNTVGAALGWGMAWLCVRGLKNYKSSRDKDIK